MRSGKTKYALRHRSPSGKTERKRCYALPFSVDFRQAPCKDIRHVPSIKKTRNHTTILRSYIIFANKQKGSSVKCADDIHTAERGAWEIQRFAPKKAIGQT